MTLALADWLRAHWPCRIWRDSARRRRRAALEALKEKVARNDQAIDAGAGALREAIRATDSAFVRLENRTAVVKSLIGQVEIQPPPAPAAQGGSALAVLRQALRRAGELPVEQGFQSVGEAIAGRRARR